jgi:hypothetical protein
MSMVQKLRRVRRIKAPTGERFSVHDMGYDETGREPVPMGYWVRPGRSTME